MTRTGYAWFDDRLVIADSLVQQLGVLLIVNVEGRTETADDYDGDSVATEFLTVSELDDMIEAFHVAGFYCDVIENESGFLNWLQQRRHSVFPRQNLLVYNLAQSGTGPARLSLVPGLCRLYGLRLVDSDGYAVSVARHKFHTAAILRQCALPAARSWWFTSHGWFPKAPPTGLTVIAKPTYESASIGIDDGSVFEVSADADSILASKCALYRQPFTVQEFVRGFEAEVPVFEASGPRTLATVGLEVAGNRDLDSHFLKYTEIAANEYSFYDFADVNPETAQQVGALACRAFRALGLSGIGRIDFRIRGDGAPYIIEVACKPHLTRHSSFAFAATKIGADYPDLLKFLIGGAIERHQLTS